MDKLFNIYLAYYKPTCLIMRYKVSDICHC